MKKYFLQLLFIPGMINAQQADTLLYDNFESGVSAFTLNTTDLGSVSSTLGYNEWVINNEYAGGSGQFICLGFPGNFTVPPTPNQPVPVTGGTNTNYMHITSEIAHTAGIYNCCFYAADGLCASPENYFSRMSSDINTTGYDSVHVSFLWLCAGSASNYGEFYYSTNGGFSWQLISTPFSQFNNHSGWTAYTNTLPAFAGQNTLRFGFRFVNPVSFTAADPAFGIDEFLVTGSVAAAPPVAAFSVSDSIICQDECVDYTDISTGDPTSWLWIFQGSSTSFSSQQNPMTVCYPAPGTYTTTLIVTNTSGTDTLTLPAVTVLAAPASALTNSGDTLFATPGYLSYQWYADSMLIATTATGTLVVTSGGNYYVTVSDTNGCSSTSNVVVMTTNLAEIKNNSTLLYPNPTHGMVYVSGNVTAIEVYNLYGQQVFYSSEQQPSFLLDFLPTGVYLVRLRSGSNTLDHLKLIRY